MLVVYPNERKKEHNLMVRRMQIVRTPSAK